MLYDNALLVALLSDVYQLTKDVQFKVAIEETLAFVEREMLSEEDGFYAALDADSEGEEGKFYVWQKEEVLDAELLDAGLICDFWGVTEKGNWEGKNILNVPIHLEEFLENKNLDGARFEMLLEDAKKKLLTKRSNRIRPGLDDKIILGWNALQCIAYAKAARALDNDQYRERAEKNLDFLLSKLSTGNGVEMYHTYKNGAAQYLAFLDDYAFLIQAILEVYELNFDLDLLKKADLICQFVIENFLDPNSNLFYFTATTQDDILLRKKELYDSATPSGNSSMAGVLHKLGILLDNKEYLDLSDKMLVNLKDSTSKYPTSFSRWASNMLMKVQGLKEIAIVGPEAKLKAKEFRSFYLPYFIMMAAESEILISHF